MLAFLIVCCLLDEPAAPASASKQVMAVPPGLASPFFEVRAEAQARLLALRQEDGQAVARELLRSADPRLRLAGVEWYRSHLELGNAIDESAFAAALRAENDPEVRVRALHVVAQSEALTKSFAELVAAGSGSPAELEVVLDARIVHLCEQVMLDGGVPGFFDGQFAAMHAVDSTALIRILRFAWDPRLHPVVRTLMIVALHETRPPGLEMFLQPLLVRADLEVILQYQAKWNFNMSAYDVRESMRMNVSQYARFSLAKAGIAGPIEQKISELKVRYLDLMRRAQRNPDPDRDRPSFTLEEALDFLFQVGYHEQQLDRYDEAEAAYREIALCREDVRVKRWAHYNLACIRAIQGRNDEAIAELEAAVRAGFNDVRWAARDGDLKPLRDDLRFQRILAGMPAVDPKAPKNESGK
jgi:tetratricopeptide (TPR) repeat protein